MTIVTRYRKLADRRYAGGRLVGSVWAVEVKGSGRRWITVGEVKGSGRRWTWLCNAPRPHGTAGATGREDTRAEARTALLAHVREGDHLHLTEGDQDG